MVQKAGTKHRKGRVKETQMPALPRNCYKTPQGFLFRIVVPEALRPAIGKREIKKSLGRDYREAVTQARLLALQVDHQFSELQEQTVQRRLNQDAIGTFLATPADKRLKPITEVTPELAAGLRSLWLSGLEADLSWRREGLDDDAYDELQQNITQVKGMIAQALARGQPDAFTPLVRNLLAGRGYQLAISPEDECKLVLDVLPAIQEGYDILEQRQAGRLIDPPKLDTPPLRAAWEPAAPSNQGNVLTWQQLLEHWKNDRVRPVKTTNEVETYIKAIVALFPKVGPATLTRAQVTEWLRNERETRGNGAKTLEKKGTLVGALFSVALKDELLEKNPFAGFDYSRFATKEGIEDPDEREPFTLEQLKRIFSQDEGLFSVIKDSGGGGYHARVWISLLALYSGARIDEVGSLTLADISREPILFMHIRRGKNQSSVREVPIHPRLIELGFLNYVEAIRKAGHESLWPFLRTDSDTANPSEILGKWFNRFIHEKLGMPSTVVFHSFRHNFKDMCRDALIPRDIHQALTGHAKQTVGDTYGKGYSLEVKLDQMKNIKLDLAILRPVPYSTPRKRKSARSCS